MSARRATSALLAVLALAACGGSEIPTPAPTAVTPASGSAATATPIVIHGTGFSVLTVQPSSGGAPSVDATFQAWVGDRALENVRWVDDGTLSATVPAGLAAGPRDLRVQGPFGTSGGLTDAFTVEGIAPGSLSLVITAAPANVNVGQAITVTLTVTNTSPGVATGVVPESPAATGTGTVGAPTGPVPASIASLAPGASGTFTWTYTAAGPGTLAFSGAASMTLAGATVRNVTDPSRPAQVAIARPGALTASLPAAGAGAIGQEFSLVMTVTNAGGAGIRDVVPTPPTPAPGGMATLKPGTGAVPASLALLAAGASATFTWTFVAGSTSGAVQFASAATGTDVNSGATVASGTVTSGSFTIGSAGITVASFAATPATVSVGQAVTLTLTVTNPGLADVRNFVLGTPSVSSTDGATAPPAPPPTPAPPADLAAGQTFTTTWTFQPTLISGVSTGHLTFRVTLSGTDAFSGLPVSAQASAASAVQVPAGLAATLTPARTPPVPVGQPFTVDVGQAFTLTLAVSNTGAASANAVTPTPITGCAAPSPASATVSPGTPVTFLYAACSSATVGALALSASASGTDANDPTLVVTSNAASASVTVQAPAAVTGALSIPLGIAQGLPFNVTLTLSNSGGAPAVVTPGAIAVAAGSAGAATLATGPTPASITIPGGGSASVQWTYNATSVGAISFTGNASGIDSNTGAAVPVIAIAASNVGTIGQGGLAISIGVSPSATPIGQQVLFTMTVTNSGTAAVTDIVPSLTLSGATGTLGQPIPASIASLGTIAPGNAGTFTWTFDSTTSGPVTATASATGTDALSLAPVSASTVANDILQVQATLGGTVTGLAAGAGVVLQNNGADDLAVTADGTFTFATPLNSLATYDVTVAIQPTDPSQTCAVTRGGAGTIGSANINDVGVTCVTNRFTVGGTVTGLAAGGSVVLQNNGADDLVVSADGTFTFITPVASGGSYSVTVLTQPTTPEQTCAVTAASGTVTSANITSVVVTCVTNGFTVGGTASGLAAGNSVVLQNNGTNDLTVSANGAFTFTTPVASGGSYSVTVLTDPTTPPQTCAVTPGTGSGTVTNGDVTTVTVTCTP